MTQVADNGDQTFLEDLSDDDDLIVSEVILDWNLIINGTLGDDNVYIRELSENYAVDDTVIFTEVSGEAIVNEIEISETTVEEDRVNCEICGKRLKSKKTLRQHMQRKHTNQDDPLPPKKCPVCLQIIEANKFNNHIEERHTGIAIEEKCDLCDLKFKNFFNLKRHKDNVHNINKRF